MADSPLIIKSKTFALDVIQVYKQLRVAKCESALINQFFARRNRLIFSFKYDIIVLQAISFFKESNEDVSYERRRYFKRSEGTSFRVV